MASSTCFAAVLGFTGNLGELLSIDGTMASDNFLQLVSGIAAILVGRLGGDIPERRVEVVPP